MTGRKRPERRGNLSGLLGTAQNLTRPAESETLRVPLAQLRRYEAQPRRSFPQAELEALAESIRQRGVLQPLLVRPAPQGQGYEIAAGERRFRASQLAGLSELPVLIRDFSDAEMLEVGLIENLQREGLNTLDEIEGKLRLLALSLEVTPDEARQRLMSNLRNPVPEDIDVLERVFGLTGRESWQSFAKNKVRVLQWPPELLDAIRQHDLAFGPASVVAAAPAEQRAALLALALAGASTQELRTQLKAEAPRQKTTRLAGKLEAELSATRQKLGQRQLLGQLDRQQQGELQEWLRARPEWLK